MVRRTSASLSEHCFRAEEPCSGKRLTVQRGSSSVAVTANSPARKEKGGLRHGSSPNRTISARRVLTFRDLLLYYLVTGFSLRWTATAAAAGPSALVIWVIAALGLFVPLVFTVLELSSRYPEEGGVYVWSKRAFGPFAAFITGWCYWGSNLPYLPGLLYFGAANALYMGGPAWQEWSTNSAYFIAVAICKRAVSAASCAPQRRFG